MSQQIQISGGAKVRDLQDVIIGTSGVLSSVAFNVANGVPKLDVNGKILVSQLPNSVMEYKGTWSAATNTPTLANGTGNQGDVYLCNVAGTVDFGAGPIAFVVGDQVIYSGSIWQRASGATGTVTSVGLTESGDSLNITGSPITTSGTINIGFNGTNLQYVNGAGNLTTFPILTGYVTAVSGTAPVVSSGGTTPAISMAAATALVDGYLLATDFAIFSAKQSALTFSSPLVNTSGTISIPAATTSVNGYLASADFTTFNNKQNAITLTTTGTSGASTLVGATLNIPNYGSALTGYVPYTGATQDVDLGVFSLNGKSLHIKGTAGNGHLGLKHQSAAATGSANESLIYADTLGDLNWLNGNLYLSKFITSGNTAARSYTFPNATCNIPNDSLVVHLAGTETITGAKTFSGYTTFTSTVDITSGLTFSNSGFTLVLQPPTLSVNRTVTLPNGTGTLALTSDISYPVTSVFGRTGAVVATSGDYTTAQVTESGNLYFTDSRARLALSFVAGSGAYNSTTGVITIPTNNTQITNGSNYITLTSLSGSTGISYNNTTGAISSTITQYTDALARLAISLTTTGTSGAATYNSTTGVLNIPQYIGGVTSVFGRTGAVVATEGDYSLTQLSDVTITSPTTGQVLKYNGTAWINDTDANSGTVTSVAMTVPTGLSVSGSPITTSGTLGVTFAAGYSIPTNASQTTWDTAYINRITSATSPLSITSNVISISQATTSTNGYLSSTDWNTFNGKGSGTVTSVAALTIGTTGTDLSSSVANSTTTPVITLNVPTASAANRGALSSADWTTFNNKQNALTNPVTGTGTTNYLSKFTGTSTIGNSVIQEASNNIGIGHSPSYKFDINNVGGSSATARLYGNDQANVRLRLENTGGRTWELTGGLTGANNSTFTIYDVTAAATRLQIDASGNLGLGVTPSAWVGAKALQMDDGSIWGISTLTGYVSVGGNYYYDGSYKYIKTSKATDYYQYDGQHAWRTAPSGTAGAVISFTQAMTLFANGNLGVGVGGTDSGYKLDVSGTGRFTGQVAISQTTSEPLRIERIVTGATVGNYSFAISGAGNFSIYDVISGSDRFIINKTTGAATFSSSVTATQLIVGSGIAGRNAFSQSDFRIAAPNDTNILNGIAANGSMTIKSDNYGGGSATPLILQSGANSNQLYLATSGNIGIGTSSPQANLQVLGTIKVATGNAQGILGLGEANGTTVNVGIWRGAANNPTSDGNYLNLGGYEGIVLATGNAAIGSQTTRLTIASTGAATFSSSVTATSFFESSSIKGKDIIATNPLLALDIDVIKYTRKSDESKDIRYGYSAEQIHSLMPELTDKDVTAVKYLDVHTILIANLQKEIRELKAKINN